ncbi:molybdenum cofactor biosysynthesis protein [Serinicoccus chungangensis]|uniref:Molybdenum cofactor biosysynthesis protein n=1 Tax=Serinicoccus chungangensis TaxID=767452 RepID=A0A0W8I2D9_9MICO|nr:molybdenum cofactor biosysynthesis protein [Serinicoccus chungangensis]
MPSRVLAVQLSPVHEFRKEPAGEIELVEGYGVRGDAHAGATVQHLHRVKKDPTAPNLRQVHLIHAELFDDLAELGHTVRPGDLGENVTTTGLDLLALARGTRLTLGAAEVQVTGLRNPCYQIDDFQPGLLKRVLRRHGDGAVERLTGVMAVVTRGGTVRPGDHIGVAAPGGPLVALAPV